MSKFDPGERKGNDTSRVSEQWNEAEIAEYRSIVANDWMSMQEFRISPESEVRDRKTFANNGVRPDRR